MALLDNLNAAVTGAMQGDALAEQQLLTQLQTMNQTLTAAAPIFETARQIPIATTLGKMNLANAEYLRQGMLPLRQLETEQAALRTPAIEAEVTADQQQHRLRQHTLGLMANVAERMASSPDEQTNEYNLQTLERLNKLLSQQKLGKELTAVIPQAGEVAAKIQTQAGTEADAAAAAAEAKRQAMQTMTQRFLWQPSLTQQVTQKQAQYEIGSLGRKATAEQQQNIQDQQRILAAQIELIPQATMMSQFLTSVKTDPAGALNALNRQLSSYKSAQGGYPRLNTLMSELADRIVNPVSPADRVQAQQSMNDLDQGIRTYNYFKQNGVIPSGLGMNDLHRSALELSLAGLEGPARLLGQMAQGQDIREGQALAQSQEQASYGLNAHFRWTPIPGGQPQFLTASDYVTSDPQVGLIPSGKRFIDSMIPLDNPQDIGTVRAEAAAMQNQPHLYQAVGYGWANRAREDALSLSLDTNKNQWILGRTPDDKKQEALAYQLNRMPSLYSRLFPNALRTAKSIAATRIGLDAYRNAENALKTDMRSQVSSFTNGRSIEDMLQLLNPNQTTPEQIRVFEDKHPGYGFQIQQAVIVYLNTLDDIWTTVHTQEPASQKPYAPFENFRTDIPLVPLTPQQQQQQQREQKLQRQQREREQKLRQQQREQEQQRPWQERPP